MVKALVNAGAMLEHKDNEGRTALMHVSIQGHIHIARELLAAGAIVEPEDSCVSPLMVAALRGNLEIVEELLDAGAEIYRKDGAGMTALDVAKQEGYLGIVSCLQAASRKPTELDSGEGYLATVDCLQAASGKPAKFDSGEGYLATVDCFNRFRGSPMNSILCCLTCGYQPPLVP